jgi:hypothetical protein
MKPGDLGERRTPLQFEHQGTRELVAEDFVYALKRHATTRITTPIFGTFSEYVVGLADYGKLIKKPKTPSCARAWTRPAWTSPSWTSASGRWPAPARPTRTCCASASRASTRSGSYWMQMTFMAPVPWEADAFYAQPGMAERGLSLDRWPVGTGPYMMAEFVQDRRHVMKRNPNYRGEPYPCEGMPGDKEGRPAGRLRQDHALHRHHGGFTIEREAVPQRQVPPGLLRRGGVRAHRHRHGLPASTCNDSERCARVHREGLPAEPRVRRQQLLHRLQHARPGGRRRRRHAEQQARNRKLRQAISIAIDWEEYSKHLPQEGRRHGDEPAAAGHLRLARRHGRGFQPGHAPCGRTARRSAGRSRTPRS